MAKERDQEVLETKVDGDTAEGVVSADQLQDLKQSVQDVCAEASDNITARRELSHNTRFCFWEGQDESGKKLKAANGGKEVFPFEGASDVRVRTADDIVNYLTGVLMAAATRASTRIEGLDGVDQEKAARLRTLLKWLLKNKLGRRFFRELVKACQYMLGDSPGVAVVGIYWKQEEALEWQPISLQDLPALYANALQMEQLDPATAQELVAVLLDMANDQEALMRMEVMFPMATKARRKTMLREFRETGESRFPNPYLKVNRPEVCAHRLFQDLFIPSNCTDIQEAPYIHRRCLLTKGQVQTRQRVEGWSDEFVTALLEKRGQSAFTEADAIEESISEMTRNSTDTTERLRDKYEVIYTHERIVNSDNVQAVYVTVWSATAEKAAKDRYMQEYYHGDYPYVEMPREILNDSLWDSRGVPEIVATDQAQQKRQDDQFCDHTTLVTVPPFTVPRNRPHLQLKIAPLALVKEDRPGQIGPMKMMPYPRTSEEYAARIMQRVAWYFGIPIDGVPESVVIAKQQMLVNIFLASLSDMVRMVTQLSMQYMEPEELMRVMAGKGNQRAMQSMQELPQTRREIQGMFDVHFWLDVRTLDNEFVLKIADAIGKIVLPMDTKNTAERDKLVQMMFSMIDPQLADEVLTDVESVSMQEIEEEEMNFVKAYSGIEPEMAEDGQNFELRAQWLQQRLQMIQQQPEAYAQPSPATQEIWQRRMQHLGFMVQQQQNAQTGRVGVQQ